MRSLCLLALFAFAVPAQAQIRQPARTAPAPIVAEDLYDDEGFVGLPGLIERAVENIADQTEGRVAAAFRRGAAGRRGGGVVGAALRFAFRGGRAVADRLAFARDVRLERALAFRSAAHGYYAPPAAAFFRAPYAPPAAAFFRAPAYSADCVAPPTLADIVTPPPVVRETVVREIVTPPPQIIERAPAYAPSYSAGGCGCGSGGTTLASPFRYFRR